MKVLWILILLVALITLRVGWDDIKRRKREKDVLDSMFRYPFGRERTAKDFPSGTICVEIEFPWEGRKRYVEYRGRPEDFHKIRASVFGALFSKMGVPYWKLGEAMRWTKVDLVQRR